MQPHPMGPTEESERLVHLDILRGFALFGILLVNFQWFTRPLQAIYLGYDPSLTDTNLTVDWLISWLAEGKFYPLFALLFGVSFTLMAERADVRDTRFWTNYCRRLLMLAFIGLLHVAFVWSGDILLVYAVCAAVMLVLFRRTPVQRLWKWALVPIGIPFLLIGVLALSSFIDPSSMNDMREDLVQEKAEVLADVERARAVYSDGSYIEVTLERINGYLSYVSSDEILVFPMVIAYFLLGRWLAVSRRVIDLHRHRRFLRSWAIVGFPLGLVLSALAAALMYRGDIALLDQFSLVGAWLASVVGVVLPLGYLAVVVLNASTLRWLVPVGRMALSQYLLQSLVWTTVFYGYGLGLWGQVPRIWHPALVVVFFALQVVSSHWWLKHFRYGPVEWLWRCFTYWRWQPLRRELL